MTWPEFREGKEKDSHQKYVCVLCQALGPGDAVPVVPAFQWGEAELGGLTKQWFDYRSAKCAEENKATGTEGPSKLRAATQAPPGREHTIGLRQDHSRCTVSFWLKLIALSFGLMPFLANQFKMYEGYPGGLERDDGGKTTAPARREPAVQPRAHTDG